MLKKIFKKLKNKPLLVLVILVVLALNVFFIVNTFSEKKTTTIWDGTIAKSFSSGDGTSKNPYIIKDGSELAYFFKEINSDNSYRYNNKFFRLDNNINLDDKSFNFASDNKQFTGYFDGQGYTISNFKLNKGYIDDESEYNINLFDSLHNALFENVNFKDVELVVIDIPQPKVDKIVPEKEQEKVDESTQEIVDESDSEKNDEEPIEQTSETKEETEISSEDENSTLNEIETKVDEVIQTENANEVTPSETASDIEEENVSDLVSEEKADEPTKEETEEIESYYKMNISLFKDVENSVIRNVSVNNIHIVYDALNVYEVNPSLFILNDIKGNEIYNINIVGEGNYFTNTSLLIFNYNNAKVQTILYSNNKKNVINNYKGETDEFYEYNVIDNKLVFEKNFSSEAMIGLLNMDSSVEWKFTDGIIRMLNTGVDPGPKKIKSSAKSAAPSAHASGIDGNTVYVNNYQMDYDYYMGLNYTNSPSGTTPTLNNKNLYNDNNLYYVQVHYHGSDVSGNNVGHISKNSGETQTDMIYYIVVPKTYDAMGQEVVRFELIDNPFADRPNNKVFNGWVSTDSNAKIILDTDIYVRYLEYLTSAISNNRFSIDIYASWTNGKITDYTGNWNNAFNNLDSKGFHVANWVETNTIVPSINGYYTLEGTVSNNRPYPSYCYTDTGQYIGLQITLFGGGVKCSLLPGQSVCNYYHEASGTFNPNTTYYHLVNGRMTADTSLRIVTETIEHYSVPIGESNAGYYKPTTVPNRYSKVGYYNTDGTSATGTCTTSSGCAVYELIPYYDEHNNLNVAENGETFYYLTTRDTNVVYLSSNASSTWGSSNNYPFTLTGYKNGNTSSATLTTGGFDMRADTRIEHIKMNSNVAISNSDRSPSSLGSSCIEANYYNVKFGRGITKGNSNNTTADCIEGGDSGTGSNGNPTKYRTIIESGVYNSMSVITSTKGGLVNTATYYVNGEAIYGCDYDRIKNDNSKFTIQYTSAGSWHGNIRNGISNDRVTPAATTIVKSGTIGANKYDYTTGIYVAGLTSGAHYAPSVGIIEGGYIYNLIGGPLSENAGYNDSLFYIKGGTIDLVTGGAGRSETEGNRIIQATGGNIRYAICGGSNGATGSNGEGVLAGDTYIYVGGHCVIGDDSLISSGSTLSFGANDGIESGSIFGAGNGNSRYSSIGTVYNSYIVLDGEAQIKKNVYGGGNFGVIGSNNTGTTNSQILINGSTVQGAVFGGSNKNDSSTSASGRKANINITMNDGNVANIYGGANSKGIVYGDVNIAVNGGDVGNVYGGGFGGYTSNSDPGTYVRGNVNITIGTTTSGIDPHVTGNVYGGSALGTVNSTSNNPSANSNTVKVTVNNGKIDGAVFGGAKGGSGKTPYIAGNIEVRVNDGTVNEVYCGFDETGTPKGTCFVYLDGGTITNAFGGGNKTNLATTNIYQRGANVGSLYGGSNNNGTVTTANVYLQKLSGKNPSVTNVYGGNNVGGNCVTTNVNFEDGAATNVYGGGNRVNTTTTNVNVRNMTGTTTNIFGGGNEAGVGTANVTLFSTTGANNINITNLFGGSNNSGTVTTSNVKINKGTVTNVYGGNNSGGSTTTANVTVENGVISALYGGGKGSETETNTVTTDYTYVSIKNGTVRNAYGGGKGSNAIINYDTHIAVSGGAITNNLFGGGDAGNVIGNAYVDVTGGGIATVFGGGNVATVNNTIVNYSGGNTTNLYAGCNASSVLGKTTLNITNGTITNNAFGGGNNGIVTGTPDVNMSGGTVGNLYGGGNGVTATTPATDVEITNGNVTGNVYGGGNAGLVSGNSNVVMRGGSCATVFGGGNQAAVGNNTYVNIYGGSISQALYGGGNEGAVNGQTNLSIDNFIGTIPNVYGGGNQAGAGACHVTLNKVSGNNNINITNLYGGSNASGDIDDVTVNIKNGNVTYVYGGNNAGGTVNTTTVSIEDGLMNTVYGGGNEATINSSTLYLIGGEITDVFGGCNKANTLANTNLNVLGSKVTTNIFGGGNEGEVIGNTTINFTRNTGSLLNVYGGGNKAGVANSYLNFNTGGTINVASVFGGSNASGNLTSSNIVFNSGTFSDVYGGNNSGGTTTTSNITVNNVIINNNLFGGGNNAPVTNSNVNIINGIFNNVFGGGNNAGGVTDSPKIIVTGGTINGNLYGGGNKGVVTGNTNVLLNNATIKGSAYAGGNGTEAIVNGNTYIDVGGGSVIGTPSCSLLSQCSVFGGGNAAKTGDEGLNTSKAIVNIAGGTIYGNVYGGANTSKVCGTATVNIGNAVTLYDGLGKGPVHIYGTVFGGGEANAAASEYYDWSFISVSQGIDVNIDGYGYSVNVDGSIFGSGNASSAGGTSTINIKNFGSYLSPKRSVSIQRTNLLNIDNSSLVLSGAADRTNDYSDTLFTLSLIDELDLKNSSTLYLETGTNILKNFKSLNADGSIATVTIDKDRKTITKSTDNRLYLLSGKNVNVAKNANVTDYGDVDGMTFLGLYKYNGDNSINVGIYDTSNDFDDPLDWSGTFTEGSYVLGLHKTDPEHDITADGFYTNIIDESTNTNTIDYIEPTPPESTYYMWVVGKSVINYSFTLNASKYSTLGTYELSLMDFTAPNTSFEILSFDYSGLASGVDLVKKRDIPRIASTEEIADSLMGLSMETSNSGWLVNGKTDFLNDPDNPVDGTINYIGGNNTLTPTLLFYLHHAKNISSEGDMGTVSIQMLAVTQIDDLTKNVERLVITIDLARVLYTTADYEAAMTAGRKYSLFTSTSTNITSTSSISAYYSLFYAGDLYRTGYHRALSSNYALPEGTKITMIDIGENTNEYYYHVITEQEESAAIQQIANQGDALYPFSMFEIMGSQSGVVKYNDALKNVSYYDEVTDFNNEEFIFIVDFDDCNITSNSLNNSLLIEMLDADNETVITVLGAEHANMVYNIYAVDEAALDISGTINKDTIYSGESATMNIEVDYKQIRSGAVMINDTHLFDSKLGIKLSLINPDNEVVNGTSMIGLYYTIGDERYYPNIDGTTRIKIADRVDSVAKWITINTGTSGLPSGLYKLLIETYGSSDGIYYGSTSADSVELEINIVNEIWGLDASVSQDEMVIYAEEGKNVNGNNQLNYTFTYNSGLTNPNIRVKMYRRDYTSIDSFDYHEVDAADYFTNFATNDSKIYTLINNPNATSSFKFSAKDHLLTGTYKLEFMLYDNNSFVGSIEKYIIIK